MISEMDKSDTRIFFSLEFRNNFRAMTDEELEQSRWWGGGKIQNTAVALGEAQKEARGGL